MSALALLPGVWANTPEDIRSLARLAVLSLPSTASRRNYSAAIELFLGSANARLNRSSVQAYLVALRESGKGPATQNVALAAIKLLAREAYAQGQISDSELSGIVGIRGAKSRGTRAGNWIDLGAARLIVEESGRGEQGTRNAAMVALMLGCGIRREELVRLDWSQYQARAGRMCLVDIRGKGGRIRTVPVPRWVEEFVEKWREETEEKTL